MKIAYRPFHCRLKLLLMAFCVAMPAAVELSAQESGSAEKTGLPFPIPFDDNRAESGSTERSSRVFPRRERGGRAESGSSERRNRIGPINPDSFRPSESKKPLEPPPPDPQAKASTGSIVVSTEGPNLIVPVLIFLAGLFLVAWSLFRLGLFNPYTANLWPKRLELCIEIALRMDDLMTAFHEKKFEKCQMALDALNHLNGRRSILLSNPINSAVNRFVESAVRAKVSADNQVFQNELNHRYESVIEALRQATRQEELSLEVLHSLTKAQGPHRKLQEPPESESEESAA